MEVSMPENPGILEIICILYGFSPAIYGSLCLLAVAYYRNSTSLKYFMYCLLNSAICELIKLVLNGLGDSSRPRQSACKSLGMPSGHASISIGWLTILILDLNLNKRSVVDRNVLTIACILLLPVPASRVLLGDHSAVQVIVGIALGLLLGNVWFTALIHENPGNHANDNIV